MTDELVRQISTVLEREGNVRFAILFGSVVTHGFSEARDIDLAVSFVHSPSLMELGDLATKLEQSTVKPVDLLDVDEANTLIRWEIVRTGRLVFSRDDGRYHDLMALVPREYADLVPFLEQEAAGLRARLKVG